VGGGTCAGLGARAGRPRPRPPPPPGRPPAAARGCGPGHVAAPWPRGRGAGERHRPPRASQAGAQPWGPRAAPAPGRLGPSGFALGPPLGRGPRAWGAQTAAAGTPCSPSMSPTVAGSISENPQMSECSHRTASPSLTLKEPSAQTPGVSLGSPPKSDVLLEVFIDLGALSQFPRCPHFSKMPGAPQESQDAPTNPSGVHSPPERPWDFKTTITALPWSTPSSLSHADTPKSHPQAQSHSHRSIVGPSNPRVLPRPQERLHSPSNVFQVLSACTVPLKRTHKCQDPNSSRVTSHLGEMPPNS
jgi:hypothetical protein